MRNMVMGEDRQGCYNMIADYYGCIHKKFIVK